MKIIPTVLGAVDPDIQAIIDNVDSVWGVVMPFIVVVVSFGVLLFFITKLKGGGSFRNTRDPDSEMDPRDKGLWW